MLNIYKASAGSGKTYTLTKEYISLLFHALHDKRAHSHILAVTFTKKATAQMKERILHELYQLSVQPAKSAYYNDFKREFAFTDNELQTHAKTCLFTILQDYTHFEVSTIDGFFQQIIRAFARELGLPATYNLALQGDEIIQQAVDDLFFAMNHKGDAEQSSTEWMSHYISENIANGQRWNPKSDISAISVSLLTERLQMELQTIRPILKDKTLLANYKKQLQDMVELWENSGLTRKRKLTDEQQTIKRNGLNAQAILKHFNELGLLSDITEQIQLTNRLQNRLPISDTNLLLHRVIDNSETPFIYEKTGSRILHYMIDEFQDTSTLQWANFSPLVKESNDNGRKNLVVGDVKQSIYRWRNSDWHLLEGLEREIQPCQLPLMDTNYRSSAVIVNANNDIFRRYVDWVANAIEAEFPNESGKGDSIRSAYSTLHQNAQKTHLPGYIRMQFFDADKKDDNKNDTDQNDDNKSKFNVKEATLEALPGIIDSLLQRGCPAQQIAILVRGRKEATAVSSYLLSKNYDIESADGLLVSTHPAVEMLTTLLGLSITPDDEMLATRLRLTYAEHLYADDPQRTIDTVTQQDELFTEEQKQAIEEAQMLPLYEQIQRLIDIFDLASWDRAAAYLTTFQDFAYQYIIDHTADTSAFLQYWATKSNSLSVTAAASKAIQILTIHKSKGLEFEAVIIPFLSWPVASGKQDSSKLLWCRPQEEPFNTIPLLPIQNTKDLQKTIFAKDFMEERISLYMDNLNLSYVAFTRPVRELYTFAQKPKLSKESVPSIDNVGNLMSVLLQDNITDNCYTIGEQQPFDLKEEETLHNHKIQYRSCPIGKRLRLKSRSRDTEQLSQLELGSMMHDWLAEIETWNDIEPALTRLLISGRIHEADVPALRESMQQFKTLIRDYDWFEPDSPYTVIREQDILTPTGNTYRPDRIMTHDRHAIVIDYKFGMERKAGYQEQVRNYMHQILQMGWQVEGYLVYVSLGKIEHVNLTR